MMSSHAANNLELLRFLARAPPKARDAMLRNASPSMIKGVCECARNTLNGTVPTTAAQKRVLARHRAKLRSLAARGPLTRQKRQTVQKGGALVSTLLGIALPALISILANR